MSDKTIKILVVENVKHDYFLMERALRGSELDCEMVRALRTKDAFEHLRSERFDIAMIDYSLPGETGLDMFRRMKVEGIEVPVVFVSGSGDEAVAAEAIRQGAQDYLVKDPQGGYLEMLADVIRKATEQWEAEQSYKKSQRRLEESEAKLRSFIESSAIGIWCFGGVSPIDITLPEGKLIQEFFKSICIECNETYARMMGTTRDDILGMRLSEIMPDTEENREYLRAFIRNGFKLSGGISHEIDRNGEEKYFSNSFVGTIKDGKLIEAWGTQTDITEGKRGELRRQVRTQLLDDLRSAKTIEDCLQLGCRAIRDAGLYKRAVLTLHNEKRVLTHLGQVGLDPKVVESARKAPPPDKKLIKKITRKEFKISHSFFVPEEAAVPFEETGRYIPQKSDARNSKASWKPGDELFVPLLNIDGSVGGYLSVDAPVDGKRPDEEIILYLEDVVDIVARQIHEIQNVARLRESEERFRAIFETAQDSVFIKDRTLKYTMVNPAMEKLFGLPSSKLIGKTDDDLFDKKDASHIRRVDSRVLKGQVVEEDRSKKIKGIPFAFHIIKVPMCDSSGEVIGLCGIARDITDRKRLEEELRERRMYLESVMRYTPDAVTTQDVEGTVLEWNPEAERLFGYTSEEAIGKKLDDLVASPDPGIYKEAKDFTHQLLTGKPVSPVELVRYRKDGTPVDVRLVASPILKENKIMGTVALYRDITEQKRLEKEARDRRLYLENLMNNNPDAIITADDKQRVLEWNPGAERLFGYMRDEVMGKNVDDLIAGSNPDALKEARSLTKQVLSEKNIPPTEAVRYRKDGTPVSVIVSGSPILSEGKLIGIVATYIDLTEHKREEKIRESIYRIAEAVVTTKDLNELFGFIHDTIRKLMPAENAYITLYDSDADLISFPYFVDKYDTAPQPKRPGRGLTEYVLRTKMPILATPRVISRLHREGEIEIIGTLPVSWLGVPLIVEDRIIGVVAVQSYTKGVKYTERDKEVLLYASAQIAQAIRHKRADGKLHEQMRELKAFHRITLGREDRIVELKHKVNELLERLGEEKKYGV